MPQIRNIADQVFGQLTALQVDGKDSTGKTLWKCACACGKETRATMLNLVKGVTKSCGCLRNRPARGRLDLTGQRFGRLVALRPAGSLKWLCACDCGAQAEVRTVHLSRSHTRSCGCLTRTEDAALSTAYRESNGRVAWARRVKAQTANLCEACGQPGRLHAHHVVPFRMAPELGFDTENGVVLCHPCHIDVHRRLAAGAAPGQALAELFAAKTSSLEVKTFAGVMATWRHKGGVEDLRKARHYIDKLIELETRV